MSGKIRFSWRGLVPQIFLLIILPLTTLLLAVTFGGLELHRQAMRTLVGQRDVRAVKAAAHALTDQLNQRIDEIHMLAASFSGEATSQEAFALLKKDEFLSANFDQGLAFISMDGQVLASTGKNQDWHNLATGIGSSSKNILDPTAPPGLYSPVSGVGKGLILAAAPASPQGPIAIGVFSPQVLIQNTLEDIFPSDESGSAFVVTQHQQVLFSTDTIEKSSDLSTHPGVAAALEGQSGSTYAPAGNSEHVVAYSPVAPLGWALVIEEPWDSVTSPILRTTEYAPLVLIPVLLMAIITLWFVTRRIIQPLQGLEAKANELAWGNYDTIEASTGGIIEIRHLQAALVHLAHKVKTYQQGLRSYIGAITMGQEEERRRLARELHDDTLQSLIALNQHIQLSQLNQNGQIENVALEEIHSMTEQTIQNLRRLTQALRPIYLEDLGLATALEMLVQEMRQTNDLTIHFKKTGVEARLSAPIELALYRIGQEALNNVVRHAQANQADLEINFKPDEVTMKIRDNGIGFEVPESPAEFAPSGHFGLLGIHERTDMIGAKLSIQSKSGQGSLIIVIVPKQSIGN